jgi:hypothetical protein
MFEREGSPIVSNKSPGSASELAEWMKEHLSYEMLMLQHTHRKLSQIEDQLDWNTYYESFAVHARNLYRFLTNEEDVQAAHFVKGYKAGKTHETVSAFQRLPLQVFHMSLHRPPTGSRRGAKVDADARDAVLSWIENQMNDFIGKLQAPYADAWAMSDAAALVTDQPQGLHREILVLSSSKPTATNSIIITTSESAIPKRD